MNEVAIAFVVLAEQHEMVRAFGVRAFIFVTVWRDIDFAPDDWFHATGGGLMEEIGSGEQVAMVRDGDGGHFAARCFGGEFADIASAVQERVVRMEMQVNEV